MSRPRDIRNELSGPVLGSAVQAGQISGGVHIHHSRSDPSRPVPRQLLPPPVRFTSRDQELGELDRILGLGPPVVVVIAGTGGVGKTALALQWAHRVSERFPHGQLYVNLEGFSGTNVVEPGDALGQLLRALGVPPEGVPGKLAEQAALYRSLIADRSVLVLLDNAYSAAQVRVLLPASPTSAVVITSRSRLIGLVPDGARLLLLAPLPTSAAIDLLVNTVGADRIAGELDRAEQLVNMCGGLPIALCVAGARLTTRPRLSVGRLATELADEQRRLTSLSAPYGLSVQAAFDLSYRSLRAPAAALYRRLGLHPGQDFGSGVAVAMAPDDGTGALEHLVEDNLLEEVDEDRYRFHDLLRLHARQRAVAEDSPEQQDAALLGILEWYLATAAAADRTLTPYRQRPYPYEFQVDVGETPNFATRAAALSWLDSERVNLIAAGRTALERQWSVLAWHLCDVMWPLLLYRKHYRDRLDIDRRGVAAARSWPNKWAEAVMLMRLGRVLTVFGEYTEAEERLKVSHELFVSQDDPIGAAGAREFLALLYQETNRLAQAAELFDDLLATHQDLGADRNVGLDLINLGVILLKQRRAEDAVEKLVRAESIFAELVATDPYNRARAMVALGDAYRHSGELDQARISVMRGMRAMVELGSDFGQAEALEVLAEICVSAGDRSGADEHLTSALGIFESLFSARSAAVRARLAELATE